MSILQRKSSSVHSTYIRKISDLPIQGIPVKLLLKTHKYFCNNDKCDSKTFSEHFDFVEPKAVRTKRLDEYINKIGLRDNSMDTVRTLEETGIAVSSSTVLRIVKKTKIEEIYNVKNIGIDDFSLKKREIYNSIIVDNDTHKKLEVVKSREQDDVVEVLKLFKNVETVTRDFSITYKNSINEALPNAKQIVDRFHIFKNLTDDLCAYLKRTVSDKIKLIKDVTDVNAKDILTKRQQDKIDTANRKWETIQEAKKLIAEGNTKTFVADKLKITRMTLNTYLKLEAPPIKDSNCIIDNYIPLIKKMIIEKKKTEEIYEAMKKAGYKGKMTVLNMHMKSIKQEVKTNTTYLKRSKIKMLFFYDIEKIKNVDLKQNIEYYLNQNKDLSNIIDLKKEFKEVIFGKNPIQLDVWLNKAKEINVDELNSFINLIESDIDAVKNAIIYNYSNGITEGFNNKTKVIKRQMYGRCSQELLRLKILA